MESALPPDETPIAPEEVAEAMGVDNFEVSPVISGARAPKTPAERSVGMSTRRTGFSTSVDGTPNKASRAIYVEYMSGGYTLQQIADKWGVPATRVKRTVDRVHEWTNRNWQKELGPLRSSQDMELQELKTLAMQAFQRTTQPKRTRRRVSGITAGEDGGAFTKNEVVIEESAGDARFLAVALGAMKQRADLWGLNAPRKTAMTNVAGDGPMQVQVLHQKLEQASDETLRTLRAANRALTKIEMKQDAIDAEFTPKDVSHADEDANAGAGDDPVREGQGAGADADGRRVDEGSDAPATGQSQ